LPPPGVKIAHNWKRPQPDAVAAGSGGKREDDQKLERQPWTFMFPGNTVGPNAGRN